MLNILFGVAGIPGAKKMLEEIKKSWITTVL
jgi:hypothetical protein